VVEFDPENQLQRLDDYNDSVVQLKNSIGKMIANLAAAKEAHQQKVRTGHADWQKALLDFKTSSIRSAIDAEKLRLNVEEAELKYTRLLAEQALVEESQRASIRGSELVLDQSAIELERAQNNVKRMTMTAPIDGIVVYETVVLNGDLRQIRDGDQVSAGQPVLRIVDTASMALNGTANQVDAEGLRLGMRATIRLDAYPELKIAGTLIGVGVMAKASAFRARYVGEIPVRLRIDGRDSRLLPDLTGSADVILHAESGVLLAPRPAVFTENSQSFVFVQGGDGWTRKDVVTGLRNATHVAVRAGLQPGEIVALQWPL
jgi:Cu(I)/Ag(I) efflux system membrane fusion protein